MEKPNYGGTGWHVFINLFLGACFLVAAILGALYKHPALLALVALSAYFMYSGAIWARGGYLEEKLRVKG